MAVCGAQALRLLLFVAVGLAIGLPAGPKLSAREREAARFP
jgi:hypothetical protein